MDEGNVLNSVLQRTLDFVNHGFGLIQGDVYWLFATLLLINLTLAGLTWALSDEPVLAAFARRILYIGFFAYLVTQWPTLINTIGQGFVSLGIKAGNSALTQQQFYNPGAIVATGWSGAWRMIQAATKLTGVRATFVNLPQILIIELAALVYFVAFALLAFAVFLALVQFKVGALASFVLLPMALINKTVFLAERPIGWLFASGMRLMILALVMGLGLDLVQSVASVPAEDLTIRQAVAAALGAVSLLLLAHGHQHESRFGFRSAQPGRRWNQRGGRGGRRRRLRTGHGHRCRQNRRPLRRPRHAPGRGESGIGTTRRRCDGDG